ncbi:hypothetical protein GCM10027057_25560 [Marisediminicola antarctica]|uniref:Transposase n=1 Tax=Marisediminicola antarctica TaxID=674079 RepID=A0A7L5APQ6_9MICO|nr:hypothetical protein BHD05_12405 [Marisediminicola antarctica]
MGRGLFKTQCVKIDGPRNAAETELATLTWANWFKANRLPSSIRYPTPTERENKYYCEKNSQRQLALGELALD